MLIKNDRNDVTTILTVWKRNHVDEQINALLKQTLKPKKIIVYQCGNYVDTRDIFNRYAYIDYVHSSINLGYFGRFSIARHCTTPFTYILDDDVIPGEEWIEKSIDASNTCNAIISSSGRILPVENSSDFPTNKHFVATHFVGDCGPESINICPSNTLVDFGCNSWFLRTKWLDYFWKITPYSMKCGEDIHLSATCKILDNIDTIVLKQSNNTDTGNTKKAYGFDHQASWKKPGFFELRKQIVNYLVSTSGWQHLLSTQEGK